MTWDVVVEAELPHQVQTLSSKKNSCDCMGLGHICTHILPMQLFKLLLRHTVAIATY